MEEAKEINKKDLLAIRVAVNTVDNMLARYDLQPDPVLKNSLFLESINILLDMGAGMLMAYSDTNEYPKDLQDKIAKVFTHLRAQTQGLSQWITNPIYAPDHKFGQNIMNGSIQSLERNSVVLESNKKKLKNAIDAAVPIE